MYPFDEPRPRSDPGPLLFGTERNGKQFIEVRDGVPVVTQAGLEALD
jgi:hypothetical protein